MISKFRLPESFHVILDREHGICEVYYYNQVINLDEAVYDPDDEDYEDFIKACWLYDLKSFPSSPDNFDFDDIKIPNDSSDISDPFIIGRDEEYLVFSDDEADNALRELLFECEGVWVFRSSFLAEHTGMPEEVFKPLQDQCEGGDAAILKIIEATCGRDAFFEAVKDDGGRAYIIGRYDSAEEECGEFFIYQIN